MSNAWSPHYVSMLKPIEILRNRPRLLRNFDSPCFKTADVVTIEIPGVRLVCPHEILSRLLIWRAVDRGDTDL